MIERQIEQLREAGIEEIYVVVRYMKEKFFYLERKFLIDWEYAGINYAANDISCILCRYDWTDEQVERYRKAYVGHELSSDERRYYYAYIPICGFYWFGWGLYKGSVGDGDGFFFTPVYRNFWRYINQALESYGIRGDQSK